MTILILDNLNVAVLDDNGQQIPAMQRSIPTLIAEQGERLGYKMEGVIIETPWGKWRLFKTDDNRWNREAVR